MPNSQVKSLTINGTTYDIVDETSGYITGITVLSYGVSTYADALAAYQANRVVYCRASSNSNPATGNQLRMAFLAYVNDSTTPTEFEFQYYRSVSTHSDSQQGDQVFVYKLNSSGTWSVTTREAYTKIAVSTGLTSSYSNGVLTASLANTYGDTKNPYGTKTANYVLAGPTGGNAAVPSFRALVAADIPDLSSTYAVSAQGIPSGGTSGQVLAKNSNTNYDAGWITLPDNGAFYVTFTYDDVNDSWSCDKTAQQIYEAYIAHKTILAKENVMNSSLYYLDFIDYDEQEDYYCIKFTTQTGVEPGQDKVYYIYNSVFYYTSYDGILKEDYDEDIISGVSDVEVDGDSVVTDGIAYINTPDMSNFVKNFSSGGVTSSIRPWVDEGFGYIRYRDQSFNEDHMASIAYGVQRESNISYSEIDLSADKIDLNGRTSFYNSNNSNYHVYLDVPTNLANAVAITLPSNNGTLALTSDLPDVSGKIDTAGTGLLKSGTTLNHSNSIAAQTTSGIYPIKIDAQGHITEYGSAVSIHNVPSGGTSGQVLTKNSGTDYDTSWVSPSSEILFVTFTYNSTEDEYSCNKTAQEIYNAHEAGINVIGVAPEHSSEHEEDYDYDSVRYGLYTLKTCTRTEEDSVVEYYVTFTSIHFINQWYGCEVHQDLFKIENDVVSYEYFSDAFVPYTRKVNNKALSADVTLTASDVGAQEALVSGTNIKTVNNTSLLGSGNITINASGTSTPTASTIAEFDSSAKMNSTNMSAAEVTTFVNSLDISGGGGATLNTATAILTTAGWSNNSQIATVSGVTSSSVIIVAPAPASYDEYVINNVRCTAQGTDSLTFTCDFVPDSAVTVNVIIA